MENELAYCVKCRTKTFMAETQSVTMKNGRPALKGKCGKCGTGMYKILSINHTIPKEHDGSAQKDKPFFTDGK